MEDFNRWFSFIVGLVLIATGLIPILNKFGVLGFDLGFIHWVIISVITSFGGLYLLIDGVWDWAKDYQRTGFIALVIGVIVALMGIVPLLGLFGMSIPVLGAVLSYTGVVSNYLYVLGGILLLISGYITGSNVF